MLQPALALPIPEIRDRHPDQEPVKHGPVQAGPLRRVPGHRYFLLGKEGKFNRGPRSSGPADKSAPPGHPTASDFGPRNRFLRRAMQLAHPGRPPQLLQARKLPSCVAYRGNRPQGAGHFSFVACYPPLSLLYLSSMCSVTLFSLRRYLFTLQ